MKKILLTLLICLIPAFASAQFAPINVKLVDPQTNLPVTALAKDGTVDTTAQTTGPSLKCYANSAAPAAVSANGRDQYVWCSTTGVLNVQFAAAQSVTVSSALPAGNNNIGDVDVVTVPADPFGVNADAASSTGSISAKLRQIAVNGIPISAALPTGSNTIGTVNIGTVPSNMTVDVNRIAGTATSVNVGAADNGSIRVVPVSSGTTGSAPPTQASYLGGLTSGATGGLLQGVPFCDSQAYLDMSTATTTELVALTASRKIYVCYWSLIAEGNTTATFKRGTGTNCGTGTNTIGPAWGFDTTKTLGFQGGTGIAPIFDNQNAGDALCITNAQAVNLHIYVRYAKL